jgi:hypothetical protein
LERVEMEFRDIALLPPAPDYRSGVLRLKTLA